MTDEVRRRVCDGAVVEPTVLVDGQVAAVWKLRRDGDRAVVEVEPLGRLAGPEREAVAAEGLKPATVRRHGRRRPRRQGRVGERRRPPSARHGRRQFSRQSEPTGAISAS